MIARHHIEPDFFAEAEALRRALDHDFDQHYAERFVWQYFYVPQLYNYLRARPESLFPAALAQRFSARLRAWSLERLGLVPSAEPIVHLMVNGCSLSLHSDFHNGTFGYVYSLTRWEGRSFRGGETLLLNDGVPSYKRHHAHGEALYQLIAPRFNQLLVFDDRIVHGTQAVQGGMDPKEGRVALVGHLRAAAPTVEGALSGEGVRPVVRELLGRVDEESRGHPDVQGTMSYRLGIAPAGTVESVQVLMSGLVTQTAGYGPSEVVAAAQARIAASLSALRFPAGSGRSTLTLAVLLPVPSLSPIELSIPHALAPAEATRRVAPLLAQQPLVGSLRVEPGHIAVSFEAPMWVPSQRAQFEATFSEAVAKAVT